MMIRVVLTEEQKKELFGSRHQAMLEATPLEEVRNLSSFYSHWAGLHEYEWKSEEHAKEYFVQWWRGKPKTCKCEDADQILEANPMQYEDADVFFASGVKLHNAVNAKLQEKYPELYYPQTEVKEALELWKGIVLSQASRLVITVATGREAKQMLRIVEPRFRCYAKKHGADFLAITNDTCGSWHKNKIRVGKYASQYDQTLFFDVDSFPANRCRDLFAESDGIAIVNDWDVLVRNRVTDWVYPEYKSVMESQGAPYKESWERCLNSGVVLCSKDENPWVMPERPLPSVHCAEQFWVDSHVKRYVALPHVCNWQWWRGSDFWRGLPEAEVIHFANCPKEECLELLKWAVENF